MFLRLLFFIAPFMCFAQESKTVHAFIGELLEYKKVDYIEYYNLKKKVISKVTLEVGDTSTYYETIKNPPILMDEMYLAKYKIIKWLHNNVEKDTIEFVSFDHYGIPAAFNSKTPILYLGYNEKKGEYFQYKYQFDDAFIYKNKWVGIYNFRSNFISEYLIDDKLIKVRISYNLPEEFDINNSEIREKYFPSKFYKINRKITLIKAFDVNDLVEARVKSINK